MSLFSRLAGTVLSFLQIGGASGPGWFANSGALQGRNSANNAFARVSGANPVAVNDLVPAGFPNAFGLCNLSTCFGVDATGSTDVGAIVTSAFISCAAVGVTPFFPAGTFLFTTAAPPGVGQPIYQAASGVTFSGANAASVSTQCLVLGAAPGTPAYCPGWYSLTAPAINPSTGADNNIGTAGSPLATWAEAERRFGSHSPLYKNSMAFTMATGQTAGTDPIFHEPRLSGDIQATMTVTPVVFAAAFTGGAVTAKSRGAPGTLLQVASMPAGTLKNMLVVNTTRNSQALIDSMSGTTATMQQPQTTASLNNTAVVPAPVEDDTWATGDTLVIYSLQNLNLKRWRPVGGDNSAALQQSGGWVFTASIADPSGTGTSTYFHGCTSAMNVLVNCVTNGRLAITSEGGRATGAYVVGCSAVAAVQPQGVCTWYGGGMAAGFVDSTAGQFTVTNDAIIHGSCSIYGGSFVPINVFSDSASWTIWTGSITASGFVWGSYSVNVQFGNYLNNTGSTWVLKGALTSGALKINSVATGYTFTPLTGLWGTGTAITPAALDAVGAGGNYSLLGPTGGYIALAGST